MSTHARVLTGSVFAPGRDSETLRKATRAFSLAFLDRAMPELALAARGCGYALAVHGSLARDIDLVAIPWTADAEEADALVDRLCGVLSGLVGRACPACRWADRPHGRRAKTIAMAGACPTIDLSVMPREAAP